MTEPASASPTEMPSTPESPVAQDQADDLRRPEPLISVDELVEILQSDYEKPTLLDARWTLSAARVGSDPRESPGYADFLQGHIPGAVWIDLETALAGPRSPGVTGRHPLPDQEVFDEAMRIAGVRRGRAVVLYDGGNSLAASRAWWLLRRAGKADVRVLDGGFSAWQQAGLPVEVGETSSSEGGRAVPISGIPDLRHGLAADEAGDFTTQQVPGSPVAVDAALAGHLAEEGQLIDGRPTERFHGRNETLDPVAGHIPGAQSLAALENLTPDGHFLTEDELRARFAAVGHNGSGEAPAMMCGSGVQATHLALAWAIAHGSEEIAPVYIGSWSDWITDPDRPVVS